MKRPPTSVIAFIGVLVFAGAMYGAYVLVRAQRGDTAAADHPWVAQRVGREVAFEAPWPLQPQVLPLPDNLKSVVLSSIYLQGEADGEMIGAIASTYREGVTMSLEGAADGALANIRAMPGTRKFEPNKRPATLLGKPAIDLDARIDRDAGEPLHLHGTVFADGSELFIFMLIAQANHASADATWKRLRAGIHVAR